MSKPKLTQIHSFEEHARLLASQIHGDLDAPHIMTQSDCGRITIWADADELRAWRSQHTSSGDSDVRG